MGFSFTKLDEFQLKPKPTDEAFFLIWTNVNAKPKKRLGSGSNKKQFKMADRFYNYGLQ